MRSFSKKLAFVLAAAMVVTAFAPAAKAEAAGEMAINKQGKILYVTDGKGINDAAQVGGGKGNVASYDFAVSNKPANYKEAYSFAWSSSNPEIIKVGKAGLTTAVSVGKADVICVVTEKATGKTTTLTNTITVKANAADVEITNAADVAGLAYEVGATVDLNRAMYDANGNKTTKRGTLVTDYTEWCVEPSNGVTVIQKNGKYTFTEPGEYKLWCRTYQSSKYTKSTAVSDVVKVTIADTSLDIKQTTRNQFVIEGLDGVIGLNDVKVEEIVNTIEGDKKVEYLVKDVTPGENGTATVELFYEFNDGGAYDITVKGYDTGSLIASKGEPKSIHLYANPYNMYDYGVLVGTSAQILYRVYDANGIDVTLGDLYDSNISYTIKYTDANYDDSANYLTFSEVGDKAVVTASFCSYAIDENGEYTNEWTSKPFTFYGTEKGATAVKKIADWAVDGAYWGKKSIKLVDEADGHTLEVKIILSDAPNSPLNLTYIGQEIADNDGNEIGTAFFTSLNPDTIEIYDLGDRVELEPRRKGTGKIMVAYKTMVNDVEVNTPIGIVTVEVVDKSVMDSVSLSQEDFKVVNVGGNRVIISSDPAAGSDLQDPEVSLVVKDQYGVAYDAYEIVADGGLVGKSELAESAIGTAISVTTDKILLDTAAFNAILTAEKATAKTFQYTVKVQDTNYYGVKTLNFTVDVRNTVSNIKAVVEDSVAAKLFSTSYKLETNKYSVDACGGNVARIWTGNNSAPSWTKTASFMIWDMKNSAKYDELELGLLPDKKAATIEAKDEGAYYMVFKDGVNITEKTSVTSATVGNGTKVTLTFSTIGSSDVDGRDIVIFNDNAGFVGGAGKYEFVYYEIKVDNSGNKKLYQKQKVAFTTTVDAGKYTFVKRDAISADCDDQLELLKCFTVKDRNGKTYAKYEVYNNGSANVAKIDGVEREFYVNVDNTLSNDKSVFVDSVTFWENVGDADVEYTVDVKMFIDRQ